MESVLKMDMPTSSSSKLILNAIKSSQSAASDNLNKQETFNFNLAKLIRQNSCCELCKKCFSEKKKLIAHKKICQAKYSINKKATSTKRVSSKSKATSAELDELHDLDDESLTFSDSENNLNLSKKQKLNDFSNFETNIEFKDLNDPGSINLNFLFE